MREREGARGGRTVLALVANDEARELALEDAADERPELALLALARRQGALVRVRLVVARRRGRARARGRRRGVRLVAVVLGGGEGGVRGAVGQGHLGRVAVGHARAVRRLGIGVGDQLDDLLDELRAGRGRSQSARSSERSAATWRASATHILLLHHDAVDEVAQELVRVLLRRLGVLVVLEAQLAQEALGVERLFAARPVAVVGRVELVEEDEERGRHRQRRRERVEVRVVVGRGGREGAQGGRRVGRGLNDVVQGLCRRQRLDDRVVEAPAEGARGKSGRLSHGRTRHRSVAAG